MYHFDVGRNLINEDYKHVIEFGVYKGQTISYLKKIFGESYIFFGFDSFEGLPEDWVSDNGIIAGYGVCVKGFFSLNGEIPNIPDVKIYKGLFKDTIPEYLKVAEPIALLHIDCDLF
jgi:hypothetical protein